MASKNFFERFEERIRTREFKDYVKYIWLPAVIILGVIFADLLTKTIIENNLKLGQSITIIPDFLAFTYVLNEGAAFSILEGQRVFFIIITIIAIIVLLSYLIYDCDKLTVLMKIAVALLIGGATGNLIDRVSIGAVRDFIEIIFFGYDLPLLGKSFAIFNIADTAITIGTILLVIGVIIGHHKKEKTQEEPSQEAQG
ncbi:MAG TPA: signal peptidase II [Clostridia bacterium]